MWHNLQVIFLVDSFTKSVFKTHLANAFRKSAVFDNQRFLKIMLFKTLHIIICMVCLVPRDIFYRAKAELFLSNTSILVDDPYHHLKLPEDAEDVQVSKHCQTVMCGLLVSDLTDLDDFDIQEVASLNLCTHLVFRDQLKDGRADLNILEDEKLTEQIRNIRTKQPNLEVILSIFDSISDGITFEDYLYKSNKQDTLKTSIINLMRSIKFTGLQLSLKLGKTRKSKKYQKSADNIIKFVKTFSDLCRSNNLTFDAVINPPYKTMVEDGVFETIAKYTRYSLLSVIEYNGVISHLLPSYGEGTSLETVTDLLEVAGINKDSVVLELPFYGVTHVPEINSTWYANATELLGQPGDMLSDREDLDGAGRIDYKEICENLDDDDGNWTLYNDTRSHSMFLYSDNQWITTETTASVIEKVEYLYRKGITKFALIDIHDDDFIGTKCGIRFPLLKSVLSVVTSRSNCSGANYSEITGRSSAETELAAENSTWVVYLLVSVASIGGFFFVSGAICLLYWFFYRKKDQSNKKVNHTTEDVENQQSFGEEVKELEIPPHEYQIYPDIVLGQGKFSIVLKGKILNEDVAVKIPKRNTSLKQTLPQQLNEIETLKLLNGHKNILGVLGVSTKLIAKGYIYQFLEYCPFGSLDKYLKANRENFINFIHDDELQLMKEKKELVSDLSGSVKTDNTFSTKTLISWAYQICDGMEYVSANNDAIPWRWLPYETLDKGMILLASDVWSYGVTLWEIFSLGEVPYAGLEWNSDFLKKLKDGLRLQSPRYATSEMYNSFMLPCWALNYEDRPSFPTIKANILHCIQSIFSNGYEEVESSNNKKTDEVQVTKIEVLSE